MKYTAGQIQPDDGVVMSDFSVLSGQVSHVTTTSTVQGEVKRGKGRVHTFHKTDFRVGGKAAVFKASINIADGDQVTLVGKLKGGELHARAIRNEQTGVIHSGITTAAYVSGGILVVVGLPLSLIIIGIPLVAFGGWVLFEGYMNQLAIKHLESIHSNSA